MYPRILLQLDLSITNYFLGQNLMFTDCQSFFNLGYLSSLHHDEVIVNKFGDVSDVPL